LTSNHRCAEITDGDTRKGPFSARVLAGTYLAVAARTFRGEELVDVVLRQIPFGLKLVLDGVDAVREFFDVPSSSTIRYPA